jgi:hypothetical protein
MSVSSLAASLPSLAGTLPDLFRRADTPSAFTDSTRAPADAQHGDESRGQASAPPDDTARQLARRAALGPLTYERRTTSRSAPLAPPPLGMRGAHLDVRG